MQAEIGNIWPVHGDAQSLSGPSQDFDVLEISKSYGGVQALSNFSLQVKGGEIHGLVGENGAGKSTLIKMISGLAKPDSGSMIFGKKPYAPSSVLQAESLGIVAVQQEVATFPDLTVAENLMAGCEPRKVFGIVLDRAKMRSETQRVLDELEERIDLNKPLGQISLAQQQMVAIARGLLLKSKLLILDEPTASLSAKEANILHEKIRQLSASGVSILLVSHRLEEVLDLCNTITVLRDGCLVKSDRTENWDRKSLIAAMVGREVDEKTASPPSTSSSKILEVRDLQTHGVFGPISFDVAAGEILGLGGLVGSGRSEIVRALFGLDKAGSGTVRFLGKELKPGTVNEAISAGLALVPEDRQHEGLVLELPVSTNLTLVCRKAWSKSGIINSQTEKKSVLESIPSLRIKVENPGVNVNQLSGGNQQKVVIGKWLATNPKLLILDEPTRGVDIGSKVQIHEIIRELADSGVGVIVVSSDLPELLALSHRIVVIESGTIAGELKGDQISSENVLDLAFAKGKK